MDIEAIRACCLSMPHATEDIKPEWGDALLFRIAGKIFVSVGLGDVPVRMNVKCTPERCAELLEVEGVRRADYTGRYDWITFPIAGVFRDAELRELVRESYENIRSKLPKSALAKLEKPGTANRARTRSRA
ncbi:MAG: MmcQ/YjbR family DNA-binding protein [Terriglobales bacterium]